MQTKVHKWAARAYVSAVLLIMVRLSHITIYSYLNILIRNGATFVFSVTICLGQGIKRESTGDTERGTAMGIRNNL